MEKKGIVVHKTGDKRIIKKTRRGAEYRMDYYT